MVTLAENTPAIRRRTQGDAGHGAARSPSGGTRMGRAARGTNVAGGERLVSVLGGAALTVYGARRKDLPGAVLALLGGALVRRGATGHCDVYDALGVSTADHGGAIGLEKQHGESAVLDASKAIKVERTVTVGRPADELYRFWRSFENLPRVMDHLESVTVIDDRRSHWKAKAPAGTSVEWDAEIHNEVPNELIAWRSVDEATVPNAGSVHFREAPGGRGTEVKVVLEYQPPAGRIGALIAKLFGEEPDVQVREDLRRFKAMMETGEAATTEGQPRGR
ncbi:MAG TPA: SRPBCC family protein [Gemmatimonadaceae bacterium]|nr:SRPBCC family protein [Gemmatimonadaceae bacterium]